MTPEELNAIDDTLRSSRETLRKVYRTHQIGNIVMAVVLTMLAVSLFFYMETQP